MPLDNDLLTLWLDALLLDERDIRGLIEQVQALRSDLATADERHRAALEAAEARNSDLHDRLDAVHRYARSIVAEARPNPKDMPDAQ